MFSIHRESKAELCREFSTADTLLARSYDAEAMKTRLGPTAVRDPSAIINVIASIVLENNRADFRKLSGPRRRAFSSVRLQTLIGY